MWSRSHRQGEQDKEQQGGGGKQVKQAAALFQSEASSPHPAPHLWALGTGKLGSYRPQETQRRAV